jgi:hypothetical protein
VAGGREGAGGVTLTVREYNGSGETWDRFVEDQPSWTHFHRFGWKPVIEQTLGSEGMYLAATGEQGRLHGVLPLVRVISLP